MSKNKIAFLSYAHDHTVRELAEEYIKWAQRQRGFKQKLTLVKQLVGIFGQYPLSGHYHNQGTIRPQNPYHDPQICPPCTQPQN